MDNNYTTDNKRLIREIKMPPNPNRNAGLLVVLRSIAVGDKTIFQKPGGGYVSKQVDNFQTHSLHEGCEEREIESRLKYELYGEYPLSEINEVDYIQNIRPSILFKH